MSLIPYAGSTKPRPSPKPEPFWTDERMAEIKRLWLEEGKSATEIGNLWGVSRNAIIGKVHRLGLTRDGSQRPTKPRKRVPPRLKLVAPVIEPTRGRTLNHLAGSMRRRNHSVIAEPAKSEHPEQPEPVHCSLADLPSNGCRWPYGDGSFTFCGRDQAEESSYCPFHRDLSRGEGTASERRADKIDRSAA